MAYYTNTCTILSQHGIVWTEGTEGTLGPCECRFGDPRMTALADTFFWCACDPKTCFLAAYEKALRSNGEDGLYDKRAVFVRSLFARR